MQNQLEPRLCSNVTLPLKWNYFIFSISYLDTPSIYFLRIQFWKLHVFCFCNVFVGISIEFGFDWSSNNNSINLFKTRIFFFNPTSRGGALKAPPTEKLHFQSFLMDPMTPKNLTFPKNLWTCLPYPFRPPKQPKKWVL